MRVCHDAVLHVRTMTDLTKIRIPDGWAIETADGSGDQAYLSTPAPGRYVVTIDFSNRGFRPGMVVSGRLHGDDRVAKTKRTQHKGRGWLQSLADEAINHLSWIAGLR